MIKEIRKHIWKLKDETVVNKNFRGMVPGNNFILYPTGYLLQSSHPRPCHYQLEPSNSPFQASHSPTTTPYLSSELSSVPQNLSHQDYHLLVLPPLTVSHPLMSSLPSSTSSDSKCILLIMSLLQFPRLPFALFSSLSLVYLTAHLSCGPHY